MKKLLLGFLCSVLTTGAMASTIGVSEHPFTMNKHIVTTEFNNYLNNGTGMGLTARYLQRVNQQLSFDAGFGFTDGERASKVMAGANMQLIPDYGRQPSIAIKGLLESENYDGSRINSFGAAPTISKGFSFWGNEAFPYVALPVKVSLNTNENTYETSTAVAMGATGNLHVGGFRDLVGNIEANFSLRNSYAALVMGVSLPIQ